MAKKASLVDSYAPPVSLLAKLASIVVHVDEGADSGGHQYDWIALRSLLADGEVQQWVESMTAKGLAPAKRAGAPRPTAKKKGKAND